jgi:hypothetical protein
LAGSAIALDDGIAADDDGAGALLLAVDAVSLLLHAAPTRAKATTPAARVPRRTLRFMRKLLGMG